jgi:hypothetical protein
MHATGPWPWRTGGGEPDGKVGTGGACKPKTWTGRWQGVHELQQEEPNNRWQDTPPWSVAAVVVTIGRFILVVVAFPEPQDGQNVLHHTALGEERAHFHDQTSAANVATTALDLNAVEAVHYVGHLCQLVRCCGEIAIASGDNR